MKKYKIKYYRDETDDFIKKSYNNIPIDEKYEFINSNHLWKFFSFIFYRIILTPIAYIYLKLKFKLKIIGKNVIDKKRERLFFIYKSYTNDR